MRKEMQRLEWEDKQEQIRRLQRVQSYQKAIMREKIASDNERSMKFKEERQVAHLERMELTKQMQIEKKKMLEKFERMKKKGRLSQMGGAGLMTIGPSRAQDGFMNQTVYVKKRRMSEGGAAGAGGLSMLDTTAEQTQILRSIEPEEERKTIPMRKKLSPIVTKKGPLLKMKLDPRKSSLRGTMGHTRSNTIAMKPLGEKPKLRLDFKGALKQSSKGRLVESSHNTLQREKSPGRLEVIVGKSGGGRDWKALERISRLKERLDSELIEMLEEEQKAEEKREEELKYISD